MPLFEEAEAARLGRGVVAVPPCQDGPGDGEGGALPLEVPHVLAEGCALGRLMSHVVFVATQS